MGNAFTYIFGSSSDECIQDIRQQPRNVYILQSFPASENSVRKATYDAAAKWDKILNERGYKLIHKPEATVEDFATALQSSDTAAIVWNSHGGVNGRLYTRTDDYEYRYFEADAVNGKINVTENIYHEIEAPMYSNIVIALRRKEAVDMKKSIFPGPERAQKYDEETDRMEKEKKKIKVLIQATRNIKVKLPSPCRIKFIVFYACKIAAPNEATVAEYEKAKIPASWYRWLPPELTAGIKNWRQLLPGIRIDAVPTLTYSRDAIDPDKKKVMEKIWYDGHEYYDVSDLDLEDPSRFGGLRDRACQDP